MSKNNNIISKDRNGEFIYHGLNSHMRKKYKPDTPMDNSFVPYLIMFFCAVVDTTVFISLFKLISYDSPFMLGIQVAGFVFGFDVIPIFLAIQLRRLKQGLTKDAFIMWLALAVVIVAFAMNIILRIMTIDLMFPDLSSVGTNYFGMTTTPNASLEIDASAIALTIFGIGLPMLTSVGSFFVSYLTYNPLKVRKRAEEELLNEKKDEIRRLDALLSEYEADEAFAEHLRQDDEGKYEEMKKMHRALVISYCDYVRQRLKEHLADPTAINALSEETCVAILERLDKELAALDKTPNTDVHSVLNSHSEPLISKEYIA